MANQSIDEQLHSDMEKFYDVTNQLASYTRSDESHGSGVGSKEFALDFINSYSKEIEKVKAAFDVVTNKLKAHYNIKDDEQSINR